MNFAGATKSGGRACPSLPTAPATRPALLEEAEEHCTRVPSTIPPGRARESCRRGRSVRRLLQWLRAGADLEAAPHIGNRRSWASGATPHWVVGRARAAAQLQLPPGQMIGRLVARPMLADGPPLRATERVRFRMRSPRRLSQSPLNPRPNLPARHPEAAAGSPPRGPPRGNHLELLVRIVTMLVLPACALRRHVWGNAPWLHPALPCGRPPRHLRQRRPRKAGHHLRHPRPRRAPQRGMTGQWGPQPPEAAPQGCASPSPCPPHWCLAGKPRLGAPVAGRPRCGATAACSGGRRAAPWAYCSLREVSQDCRSRGSQCRLAGDLRWTRTIAAVVSSAQSWAARPQRRCAGGSLAKPQARSALR
mmetsp:Transcript_72337/g.162380  ORF Transcript_72337/g.162380 Transcript_72337/m.162380 type:complete len:363 (-) Transcript_72337:2577-3665(-)